MTLLGKIFSPTTWSLRIVQFLLNMRVTITSNHSSNVSYEPASFMVRDLCNLNRYQLVYLSYTRNAAEKGMQASDLLLAKVSYPIIQLLDYYTYMDNILMGKRRYLFISRPGFTALNQWLEADLQNWGMNWITNYYMCIITFCSTPLWFFVPLFLKPGHLLQEAVCCDAE